MENFLERKMFCDLKTKKTSGDRDLKSKKLEELFVFASYAGALSYVSFLSKFGKFLRKEIGYSVPLLEKFTTEALF